MRLSFLLLVTELTRAISALDIFVTPDGDSANRAAGGDIFVGLRAAQEAVRKAISGGMTEDVTIHISDGVYYLDAPLNFTAADSGRDGHTVTWKAAGSKALVSGGLKVTGWKENTTTGIWQASVPPGTKSRNLFVNGWAAQYARTKLVRANFTVTNTSYAWKDAKFDYLMTTPGIENAEIRSIQSFTDRYSPVKGVGQRELIMAQHVWYNNVIGWDHIGKPFADFGLWLQNALALLTDGGQYYLDSAAGVVYYKPLGGQDMSSIDTHLGVAEVLISISGTYDEPAHHIAFDGLHFAHSTWLRVGTHGYVDQQTGGFIGENVTYPEFEASRSRWHQNPGAIQISAAHDVHFTGGSYTQLGAGGFGIGNDPNACISGVGYGAKNISVSGAYFTQVMGNSITAGGINIPGHHPNDTRQINSHIQISENIFYNTSALFSSTVPIWAPYIQYSTIEHNDIFLTPYSGICHNYGWGMNDEGGSPHYEAEGTYRYQPVFTTPTTSHNNLIKANLIHGYGFSHTDLGAIYTLSKSPSTHIVENFAQNATWHGVYTDEGSNSLIILNNSMMAQGGNGYGWYNPNQGSGVKLFPHYHTANNTLKDNFGKYRAGRDFTDAPNGSGIMNNTFHRNWVVNGIEDTTPHSQRVAFRAGVRPRNRVGRQVSNDPGLADAWAGIIFPTEVGEQLQVEVWNFDDVALTDIKFAVESSSKCTNVSAAETPSTIEADSHALATFRVSSGGCIPPTLSVTVSYSKAGATRTLKVNGTMPSLLREELGSEWLVSSTWPAKAGQGCNNRTIGLRTGGREMNATYDDWAVVYQRDVIATTGSVSAEVTRMDGISALSKAGVVIRDNFTTYHPVDDARHVNATGYAAVYALGDGGVMFAWDAGGNGFITNTTSVVPSGQGPYKLKVDVDGNTFTGYYAAGNGTWTKIREGVTIFRNSTPSCAGLLVNSHGGMRESTAVFRAVAFNE